MTYSHTKDRGQRSVCPNGRVDANGRTYMLTESESACYGILSVPVVITDRINAAGNAIASVRLSVRLFVSNLSSEPTDR